MERARVLGAAAGLTRSKRPPTGGDFRFRTRRFRTHRVYAALCRGVGAFGRGSSVRLVATRARCCGARYLASDDRRRLGGTRSESGCRLSSVNHRGRSAPQVINALASSWGMADTQAAFAWANSLANGQERDSATAGIRETAPVGIGVVLGKSPEGYPVIQELIPGGPASLGGQLRSGYKSPRSEMAPAASLRSRERI